MPKEGPEKGFWTGVARADPIPAGKGKETRRISADENPNLAVATPGAGASVCLLRRYDMSTDSKL